MQASEETPLPATRYDWTVDDVAEFIAWRRAKIEEIGERNFSVEYPENDFDCFTQTGRPLISAQYLKTTCDPTGPIEGRSYLITADTSVGLLTGDPSAIQIMEIENLRQAYQASLKIAPDLLAVELARLSDEYNEAMIAVERNGPGIATILKLVEMGYGDRLYKHLDAALRRQVEDGKLTIGEAMDKAQYGFPTSTETKPVMGVLLEAAIRTGALGLSYQEFCDEALHVVWKDDQSWAAMTGFHDDLVVALAIAVYIIQVTLGTMNGFVGIVPEVGHAR
jgi:hypothetical protein